MSADTDSSALSIRPATAADLDELAELFDRYRSFYGRPADPAVAHRFIGERIAKGDSVILVADNRPNALAGFTQLYPSFSSVAAAPTYILNDLYVAPAFRRRGVGQALLEGARGFAQEAGAIRLSLATAIDNHAAQALYESLDWTRDVSFYHYSLGTGRG
jgi:ribosomal protein S18 acetylase RimI-like enzyme